MYAVDGRAPCVIEAMMKLKAEAAILQGSVHGTIWNPQSRWLRRFLTGSATSLQGVWQL